jgi:predicted O-linked N-acetylglucosamine transferase (SPINDLY family)
MIPPADIPALAASFQRFGALAQAEQLYRQAIQSKPGDADLWARLGRVCEALGRAGEAVTCLRRALELRPGDGVVSNDLAVALVAQGRLDEALDWLRAATQLCPDYAEAHHNQGILRMRQGHQFPYNGVTTTCDALWMGVPVISLAGCVSVSRQGVRFLRSVGLDELLAETQEDYVRIAADLAGDLAQLADLRARLRERMSCSPLVEAQRLTRDLEAAYIGIWEHRLATRGSITVNE